MTQEIKIPVSAQVDARGLDKLDDAVSGVGEATRAVARDAKDAAAAFGQMEIAARRLASTKSMLEKELGRTVSSDDAGRFQDNFDRMRKGRGIGASRLKAFDDVNGWYHGHSSTFTNQAHAAAHRRFVVARGMQGTDDSFQNGGPAGPGGPHGGGGGGGGGAVRSAAWGMVKGAGMIGLGLAGISSIAGMAGKAVTGAVSEAESVDGLKRRMGDLGVDFLNLREQARQAGAGLGVTYVESARLALEFGKEAGRLRSGDMKGMGLRDDLRVGMGLSRSYGMDPAVGVQFNGTMRRLGVTQDDQGSRRLALLIADAIEKGGFIGKAEEVLQAVSSYAVQAANFSLTTPNVGAYMAGLASLMGLGAPGLDPAGAAGLLATADGNVRRGGGRGEASMNFSYAALSGGRGGMNPVTAKALMEGGLFGTTAGAFHDPKSPLARYYAKNNLQRPDSSAATNFDKMVPMLRSSYGNGEYLLDAVKNHFGTSSYGQAAALLEMQDKGVLGKSAGLLQANGIGLNNMSVTGLQSIAQIANASSGDDLKGIYDGIMGRRDIKEVDKKKLAGAAQSAAAAGDFGAMQSALVAAVGSADQEKDIATETRDSVKAINDALTKAGSPILAALNPMRMALEVLAKAIAPAAYTIAEWRAKNAEKGVRIGRSPESYGEVGWRNLGGSGAAAGPTGAGGATTGREAQAMKYFMGKGWTKEQAAGIVGNLVHESAGLKTGAVGDGGMAYGIAQWHPDRQAQLAKFARSRGTLASDYGTQLAFVQHELETNPGNGAAALKSTGTAREAAAVFGLKFERPRGAETGVAENIHGYGSRVSHAQRLYDTPLPAASGSAKFNGSGPRVEFADAKVIIQDQNGKTRGTAKLKPVAKPTPSGGFPVRAGAY